MSMNTEVIVTCAVTGAGDTVGKHPAIPVTPKQIAAAAIEAAGAGAAVVHIHVRDPGTGGQSRDPGLFREVVGRIRDSGTDVVLNLTGGRGGNFVPSREDPRVGGPGTDLARPEERLLHVADLLPEICSLDCGSMTFGDSAYVALPEHLRIMARRIQELGVKPELEVFDTGHVRLARQLVDEGLIDQPPLFQICLGIPWGAPADAETLIRMRDMLPPNAHWAAFAISRLEMPMVAQAMLLGGNVRIGLEDNLYLGKGVFASNGQLVKKAVSIIEALDGRALAPAEARRKLGLRSFAERIAGAASRERVAPAGGTAN